MFNSYVLKHKNNLCSKMDSQLGGWDRSDFIVLFILFLVGIVFGAIAWASSAANGHTSSFSMNDVSLWEPGQVMELGRKLGQQWNWTYCTEEADICVEQMCPTSDHDGRVKKKNQIVYSTEHDSRGRHNVFNSSAQKSFIIVD